jgi:uncharacterized membrane protein YcaP (DUF421 family)
MDQPVTPFDLHRMFFGVQPLLFYAEILVRTLLIYSYTLVMIRWIGGRGVAQMSMVEFLLVIALGSAVGDAMFYPEVPVLMAMLVITIVIGMNKVLDIMIVRSDRAKNVIDGRAVALVQDGRILPEGMAACDMGPAEVKAMLRLAGVRNLGAIQHAYLESGGGVSVFHLDRPRAGLALVPPHSVIPHQDSAPALRDPADAPSGQACCARCGAVEDAGRVLPDHKCSYCGQNLWVQPQKPHDRSDAE